MRRAAGLLCLAIVSGACFGGEGEAPSVFTVAEITGSAEGRFPDSGGWRALTKGDEVPAGAAVRLQKATDALRLTRGEKIEVEIRANEVPSDGEVAAEATIVALDEVSVQTGDVLARSEGAIPLRLRSADDGIWASISDGAFRLDRRVSLRVGVYTGNATVSGPAAESSVARLREVQPRNGAPGNPMPLVINPDDPWDRRFLAAVLDLDRDLESQIAGYEGEFGRRTRSVDELSAIARDAKRDLGFVAGSLERFSSGDILVAVVLAMLVDSRGGGDAATTFTEMLELRGGGASWGIIAADRDADPTEVLASVVRGVGLRTGVVTPGKGPSIIPSRRPTSRPTGTARPTSTPTTRRPSPTPTKKPTPPPSPSPSPSTSPSPCSDVDRLLGAC